MELEGKLKVDQLERLLKIPSSMKKLDFRLIFGNGDIRAHELPTILYKFLKKHSITLEKLCIGMSVVSDDKDIEWKFPVFPVMKRLEVTWMKCNVFEGGSGRLGLIGYNECFSVLEILRVHNFYVSTAAAFLLPENVPCPVVMKSVRKVDIIFRWCTETQESDQVALYT